MNDTLDGIGSRASGLKPVVWNVAKIQAAICILISTCISISIIAWAFHFF